MKKNPEGTISLPQEDHSSTLEILWQHLFACKWKQIKNDFYLSIIKVPKTLSLEVLWELAHIPGDL